MDSYYEKTYIHGRIHGHGDCIVLGIAWLANNVVEVFEDTLLADLDVDVIIWLEADDEALWLAVAFLVSWSHLYAFDLAIEATAGDDMIAFLHLVTLLTKLFLLLLLRTNHEKVEHEDDQANEDQ